MPTELNHVKYVHSGTEVERAELERELANVTGTREERDDGDDSASREHCRQSRVKCGLGTGARRGGAEGREVEEEWTARTRDVDGARETYIRSALERVKL